MIERLVNAVGYSMRGLRAAFIHEAAFRQEVALFVVLAPLGLWLGQDGVERALLVGTLFLVMIVELVNSALEAAVDRIGPERHELSGRAKDIGSAAVFVSIVLMLVTWTLIFLGHR